MARKPTIHGLLSEGTVSRMLADPPQIPLTKVPKAPAKVTKEEKPDGSTKLHIRYESIPRRRAGSLNVIVETPAPPVSTGVPTISGITQVGQTLTVTNGYWGGSYPISYTYQWKRGATNIGTGSNTYLLVTADIGSNITCVVTATNGLGSANATSNSVGPITAADVGGGDTAPVNTAIPTISGTTAVGSVLTAATGTWTGSPTPTYAYQWMRGAPDVLPANTALPVITGTTNVGSTLTTTDGTWTGTPTPTYARQWKRNGTNISGATGTTYLLVSADIAATITCTVTATNAAGSANATSAGVGPISAVAATTTLDPSQVAAATLTNGNLTATFSAGGGTRSISSYSSGKFYCEVRANHSVANLQAGIDTGTDPLVWLMGVYSNNGAGSAADGQFFYNSGAHPVNSPTATWDTDNDLVGIAFDLDNKLAWVRVNGGNWNNVAGGNPTDPTATGKGMSFAGITPGPYFFKILASSDTDQMTVNFGATAYVNAAPAGYGNW